MKTRSTWIYTPPVTIQSFNTQWNEPSQVGWEVRHKRWLYSVILSYTIKKPLEWFITKAYHIRYHQSPKENPLGSKPHAPKRPLETQPAKLQHTIIRLHTQQELLNKFSLPYVFPKMTNWFNKLGAMMQCWLKQKHAATQWSQTTLDDLTTTLFTAKS